MSYYREENLELLVESMYSKKPITEASYKEDGNKVREFQTYGAWKSAVKKLNPSAKFTGDKDIDSCSCKECEAEWDGEKGTIRTKIEKK